MTKFDPKTAQMVHVGAGHATHVTQPGTGTLCGVERRANANNPIINSHMPYTPEDFARSTKPCNYCGTVIEQYNKREARNAARTTR